MAAGVARWTDQRHPSIVLDRLAPRGDARWRRGSRPRSAPGLTGDAVGLDGRSTVAWWRGSRRSAARWWPPSPRRRRCRWPRSGPACCRCCSRASARRSRSEHLAVEPREPRRRAVPPSRGRHRRAGQRRDRDRRGRRASTRTSYAELEPLRELLGAELAATRKVTDKGWMPHARQIGITGHAISPRLYIALGTSGKYNHTVGVRSAGTDRGGQP